MIVVHCFISALLGCLVTSQEKVCSSFCSSLGMLESNPGKSCDDIYQINKASRGVSDDYWIQTTTGVHQVYCDMELECGGHKGGWMRIADLNTTRGDACPSEWVSATVSGINLCHQNPADPTTCSPKTFTVYGAKYSKICGQARGYQKGVATGFAGHSESIDDSYLAGISITIGRPRQHVWSYAVGHNDHRNTQNRNCPCTTYGGPDPPVFVGNDYYCESGNDVDQFPPADRYYTNDPLWDGERCVSVRNNCCAIVGLPWFSRQFAISQQDDVEVRLCQFSAFTQEAVPIDLLQLYVQ